MVEFERPERGDERRSQKEGPWVLSRASAVDVSVAATALAERTPKVP